MSELKNTETAVSKFDDKLHKLIKRAKKQRGMLWPSVVSKLELARADVKAMIKVTTPGRNEDGQGNKILPEASRESGANGALHV
jgi:hypothetical protein